MFTADIRLIQFLFLLSLKEIMFFDFMFPEHGIIIIGNFDLSLPVYFNDEDNLNQLVFLAEKYGLFIRDIEGF
ncbi:hypothetical protein J23TS9_19870 [Paenibacillus sp. J23TS9]|nr:hypothetical protein J23TS9_19870 [Paenibacillus sp. J23TS9]